MLTCDSCGITENVERIELSMRVKNPDRPMGANGQLDPFLLDQCPDCLERLRERIVESLKTTQIRP
jgi:hypothetical protein